MRLEMYMMEYFKTVTDLRMKFHGNKNKSAEVLQDQESFEYYRKAINSYVIAKDFIGEVCVDLAPELLYIARDLLRIRDQYALSPNVLFIETEDKSYA